MNRTQKLLGFITLLYFGSVTALGFTGNINIMATGAIIGIIGVLFMAMFILAAED